MCSGIEAASVAWGHLGWEAAWFAEIDPFPSAVLAHHYPTVPNLGDMTALPEKILLGQIEAPDILCGGTPCQAFSVAGLRRSLDDARGNLSLTFCEIANAIDTVRDTPAIIFWENVPGVLSTRDNAFGCFLAGLAGEDLPLEPPGGRWTHAGAVSGPKRTVAWRVLDAQHFGLAQRRNRVFVVASAREGFDPAEILFEFDGVRRDTAPIRKTGEVAPTIPARSTAGGGLGTDFDLDGGVITMTQPYDVANCLTVRMHKGMNSGLDEGQTPVLAFHPTQDPISSENVCHCIGTGSSGGAATAAVAVALRGREGGATAELGDEVQNCLRASSGGGDKPHVLVQVAYTTKLHNTQSNNAGKIFEERATCLDANSPPPALLTAMQVRRLTPVECERLMGFPDGYTAVPWRNKTAPDTLRYKALGNSWAVPVVRWIGERIARGL